MEKDKALNEVLMDLEQIEQKLLEAKIIIKYGENPFAHLSHIKSDVRDLMHKLAK